MLAFVRTVERADNVKKKSEMLVKFQNKTILPFKVSNI